MIKKIKEKLIGSGTQSKIVKGVFWSFLGTLISRGFTLIAFFYIAHIITVDDYGKIGILRSYINAFSLLSLGSFGVTATKYLAIYKDRNKRKASEILSLTRTFVFVTSLLILLFSFVFSDFLTSYIIGDVKMKDAVLVSSIAIFFGSLNGLQVGALSGLERFRKISIVNVVNGLLSLPILILGAKFYGVMGAVGGLAFVNFSIWLCSAYLLHNAVNEEKIYFTFKGIKRQFVTITQFSLPSFLSSLMLSPVVLICNSLLVNYDKSGYKELGIYNAAFNYSQICITIVGVVGQVFYPYAMKSFGKGNRKFDFLNIIHPYIIGILICLPLLVFPDLFSDLFGEKYNNHSTYYTIIYVSLSTLVIAHRQGIARNFAAGNYMWWSLFSNFLWGASAILFSYLLLKYGSVGRSMSFFIAYLLNTIIFIPFYIRKNLITRGLILNSYHGLVILIMVFSSVIFLGVDSYLIRALFLLMAFTMIGYCFKKWWDKYTAYE